MTAVRCYWCLVGRGQGTAKHPAMHKTAFMTDTYLAQNVNSAQIEKRGSVSGCISISLLNFNLLLEGYANSITLFVFISNLILPWISISC